MPGSWGADLDQRNGYGRQPERRIGLAANGPISGKAIKAVSSTASAKTSSSVSDDPLKRIEL